MSCDWESDLIERDLRITTDFRITPNVRRFMKRECGPHFRFNQTFVDWIKNGAEKTIGDVVLEWKRRNPDRD